MSGRPKPSTVAEMYDWALRCARKKPLPPDYPRPHPTCDWPPENIALLEEFCEWLRSGGASPAVIRTIYLPMAGHVLGLALKPHHELDLDSDLQRAVDFLKAKNMSDQWMDVCRCAVLRFRRYLSHRRGLVESKITRYDPEPNTKGLPGWLVEELRRFQRVQLRNWRSARVEDGIRRFWGTHLRVWRFLCERHGVRELADVRRRHVLDFLDHRLIAGYAVSGINSDLMTFRSFLIFLQEEGYAIPQALLRLRGLQQPDPLPKFLTDDQVRLLRDEFEQCVAEQRAYRHHRDALLDRAAFYLMWQSALRLSEVEELRLEDLDLGGRKLIVRQGKGMKDRAVLMTDTTVRALQEYLVVRGPGPTDHVFLYRNQPVCKDLLRSRITAGGRRVGVKVNPHRLRHTAATQLLNAGCRVTSIQKLLGHKSLNTTMTYARVHDRTVAEDFYRAIEQVERRMDLRELPLDDQPCLGRNERGQLLSMAERMADADLGVDTRLALAAHMLEVLLGRQSHPLPSLVSSDG
jgi:site-specific recombinase XerD